MQTKHTTTIDRSPWTTVAFDLQDDNPWVQYTISALLYDDALGWMRVEMYRFQGPHSLWQHTTLMTMPPPGRREHRVSAKISTTSPTALSRMVRRHLLPAMRKAVRMEATP